LLGGLAMTVLVVIPTYNERINLPRVVDGVLRNDFAHVLIVDDESPDGTGAIADELVAAHPGRVQVLHRTGPRGLGAAYIDGLKIALESRHDAIGQMDADLSHDPKYLPALLDGLRRNDLVVGSRYLRGVSVVNWPLHRIALSAFANAYIRGITGLQVRDCTGGFRLWRREALREMPLRAARASGYAFLTEMLYHAAKLGLRIGEVPIVFVEREEGYSKVSKRVLIESLLTPWRLILGGGRMRAVARPRRTTPAVLTNRHDETH
jgi:dolichol-phosphate mannosyltransferase